MADPILVPSREVKSAMWVDAAHCPISSITFSLAADDYHGLGSIDEEWIFTRETWSQARNAYPGYADNYVAPAPFTLHIVRGDLSWLSFPCGFTGGSPVETKGGGLAGLSLSGDSLLGYLSVAPWGCAGIDPATLAAPVFSGAIPFTVGGFIDLQFAFSLQLPVHTAREITPSPHAVWSVAVYGAGFTEEAIAVNADIDSRTLAGLTGTGAGYVTTGPIDIRIAVG